MGMPCGLGTGRTGRTGEADRSSGKVMDLDINMRKAHMDRVNKGKCKAKLSAPFTRLLHCVDRMGNSCVNLADMAMEHMNFGYFLDMEDDR